MGQVLKTDVMSFAEAQLAAHDVACFCRVLPGNRVARHYSAFRSEALRGFSLGYGTKGTLFDLGKSNMGMTMDSVAFPQPAVRFSSGEKNGVQGGQEFAQHIG